jgi:hypothetical protein
LLLTAAVLTGCGDDGAQTSSISTVGTETTPTVLSSSDYIQQADQICAESNAAINAIVPGATTGEQAASTTQQLEITRDELSSLQTLGAPEGSSPDRFLNALGSVTSQLSRKRLALDRGDLAALPAIITALDGAEARAQAAAGDYGFKDCGDFGVPSGSVPPGGTTTAPSATTTTPPATTPVPAPPAPTPAPVPPSDGGAGTTPPGSGDGGSSGGVGPGSGGVGAGG